MDNNVSISPFNILLNNLSNELNQMNLQSLVQVCRELIPGGQREKVYSGWDVFNILLQHNAIGEEPKKMAFLLGIIKELRPKRRDLVSMVKRHIEKYYEEPEAILDDVDSSSDGYRISRCSTPVIVDHADCCTVRCGCFNCNCYSCCDGGCCCVIAAILFSFLAVMAAVFWYSRQFPYVYDYLHSKDDLKDAGPAIIGILAFIAACCVLCGIYITVKKRRNNLPFSVLPSMSDVTSTQAVHGSHYAASNCSGYVKKIDRSRSREWSCSSGRITASSSFASLGFRGTPPEPVTVVTDSGSQQDVFTSEIKEEQKENDDDPSLSLVAD